MKYIAIGIRINSKKKWKSFKWACLILRSIDKCKTEWKLGAARLSQYVQTDAISHVRAIRVNRTYMRAIRPTHTGWWVGVACKTVKHCVIYNIHMHESLGGNWVEQLLVAFFSSLINSNHNDQMRNSEK